MPVKLQRLRIQLDNLKVVLDDAIKNNRPFLDRTEIIRQIAEVERLIEERKKYLSKQDK